MTDLEGVRRELDVRVIGKGTRLPIHRVVMAAVAATVATAAMGSGQARAGAADVSAHIRGVDGATTEFKAKALKPFVSFGPSETDGGGDMARALASGPVAASTTDPVPEPGNAIPAWYKPAQEVDSGLDRDSLNDPSKAFRSPEGISYSLDPKFHDHADRDGVTRIMEGGLVNRQVAGTHGNGKNDQGMPVDPTIQDPSDAFMNVAVLTYMQNTLQELGPSTQAVERAQMLARACVEDFGKTHDCSFGIAGITFDYGKKTFTAVVDVPPTDGLRNGSRQVVAVERETGLQKGVGFNRVAVSEPEVPINP